MANKDLNVVRCWSSSKTTRDARILFDATTEVYLPMYSRLSENVLVICRTIFESALVELRRSRAGNTFEIEKNAVDCLKLEVEKPKA